MSEENESYALKKWAKKFEKARQADTDAQANMKKVIAAAMRDETTHKNIDLELKAVRKGGGTPHTRVGYGDDGEVITGYGEARPWERD